MVACAPDVNSSPLLRAHDPSRRFASTLREILEIALPNILTIVLYFLNELVNLLMLGHTGDQASLAAIGLGNMMQNCCAMSVGFGIASAMDTLVSQAHGAEQHELSCHHLQRCRCILTLQLLWMVPVLWFSGDFLSVIHQDPKVAQYAGEYNRASVWGLFGTFQSEATRKFLINRENAIPITVISIACSALHVGWCCLFVMYLRWGNAGAGYANVVTGCTECVLGWMYLWSTAQRDGFRARAVLWVEKPGLREWGSYMRVALPATLQLCSEWWFWEIVAVAVGYMGKVVLASHVCALNWVVVVFSPALGINEAAATLVGNALGANMPRKAQCMAYSCVVLNLFVWTVIAAATALSREPLSAAYSADPDIRNITQRLLLIYAVTGFFDTSQNVMGGALRGMGRQVFAVVAYVVAFYGLMLPGGIFVAYALHFGIEGMWWSFGVGTGLCTLAFAVALCSTDWRALASETAERLEVEGCKALALASDQDEEPLSVRAGISVAAL